MDAPTHYRVILRFTEEATIEEKQQLLLDFEISPFHNTNIEWRQVVVDVPNRGHLWYADLERLMDNEIIEEVLDPFTKEPLSRPRW
jgi:hypothetical protein